jgi:23S rRNA (cytidine1920-2'-O)/16S rRNA (cytidine1409-2'-O)-methyltransferase
MARRLRTLLEEVSERFPTLEDPVQSIVSGDVLVGGIPSRNPSSLVRTGSALGLRSEQRLRGAQKLQPALEGFGVHVGGRTALDLGAAAGGFTSALLSAGASRVYAVDAGHGQLLGSLRQDPRVVNLESTNLAQLNGRLVPEPVDVVTMDLSNLAVARAVEQLDPALFAASVDLIALVKPMFELGLGRLPTSEDQLQAAVERAAAGMEAAGWRVAGRMRSPVLGARGAVEFLLHGRRDRDRASGRTP